MPDGIVIDANIIPQFYKELKASQGQLYRIVDWLSNNCGIAINDHIAVEWENVCKAQLFLDWYADELKNGRIRKVSCKPLPINYPKKRMIDYGFPHTSTDIQYIECAYSTDRTKYIMTENYDFFDPKCKTMAIKARKRAREDRQGRLCRFLLKKLGIRVGMPTHCRIDFGIF
jgi:hypothetical protein